MGYLHFSKYSVFLGPTALEEFCRHVEADMSHSLVPKIPDVRLGPKRPLNQSKYVVLCNNESLSDECGPVKNLSSPWPNGVARVHGADIFRRMRGLVQQSPRAPAVRGQPALEGGESSARSHRFRRRRAGVVCNAI